MKLIVNYTHSLFIFSFRKPLLVTFRFVFGNRLRINPYQAFYNVYADYDDIDEQIM